MLFLCISATIHGQQWLQVASGRGAGEQGRLTTTFLFLYAVRDILIAQGNKDDADDLERKYLTNENETIHLKLKPLITDDDVYQRIIVDRRMGDISEAERKSNVWQNYSYMKSRIFDMTGAGVSLDSIMIAFDKLYLVCVPLLPNDDVQKIFESINSTGARLTAADLIRNYILMPIQSDAQTEYYKEYWKPIEKNLMGDSNRLELFFRMFLAIKTGRLADIGEVYAAFKKWYEGERETREIIDILREIRNYSGYYFYINTAEIKDASPMPEQIKTLRKIGVDLPSPLVVGFYALLAEGKITDRTFIDAVKIA